MKVLPRAELNPPSASLRGASNSAAGERSVPDGNPDGFWLDEKGPQPLRSGGSWAAQVKQLAALAGLSLSAELSAILHDRAPSDGDVGCLLRILGPTPPVGPKVTTTAYRSHIPQASPEEVYRYLVDHPERWFGAAGVGVRPPGALVDGGRYMLEDKGPPAVWFPIQVSLDPTHLRVGILTLDGHPLRGEQSFTAAADPNGGVELLQDAKFQVSSAALEPIEGPLDLTGKQHAMWKTVHRHIYQQFNPVIPEGNG